MVTLVCDSRREISLEGFFNEVTISHRRRFIGARTGKVRDLLSRSQHGGGGAVEVRAKDNLRSVSNT